MDESTPTINGRRVNDALRTLVRKTHDKRSRPTAAILDSQSVKSDGHGGRVPVVVAWS